MTPQQAAAKAAADAARRQAEQNNIKAGLAALKKSSNNGTFGRDMPQYTPSQQAAIAAGQPDPLGAALPDTPAAPRTPFQFTPDSGYNDTLALNKKRYDDRLTNIGTDETKTKFDFGFDDPTNPFSRVTEMKRQFLAKSKGDATSINSRGMTLSGANLRLLDRNKRSADKGGQDLRNAYEAALEALRRQRVAAGTDKEGQDLGAWQDSYNRQLAAYNAS